MSSSDSHWGRFLFRAQPDFSNMTLIISSPSMSGGLFQIIQSPGDFWCTFRARQYAATNKVHWRSWSMQTSPEWMLVVGVEVRENCIIRTASSTGYHGNILKKESLYLMSAVWETPPGPPAEQEPRGSDWEVPGELVCSETLWYDGFLVVFSPVRILLTNLQKNIKYSSCRSTKRSRLTFFIFFIHV